jgi:hypothetical protein
MLAGFGLAGLALLAITAQAGADVHVWGTGISRPQSISQAPSSWGSYAGYILVPDSDTNSIMAFQPAGGVGTNFAPGAVTISPAGGLFLPAGYGSQGGNYVTSSNLYIDYTRETNTILAINSAGGSAAMWTEDWVFSNSQPAGWLDLAYLTSPVMAPASWGTYGGKLLFTDQLRGLVAVTPNGDGYSLAKTSHAFGTVQPYGAAVAPQGFGSVGGTVLVSDCGSGQIAAAWDSGNVTTFTSIALTADQLAAGASLRQIAFVPEGYGDLSGLLLVSATGIDGFTTGSGEHTPISGIGCLFAVDGQGNVVKELVAGSDIGAYDPRGVFFAADGTILVSDVQGGRILSALPDDFQAVPEPVTLSLLALGGLALLRRRRGVCMPLQKHEAVAAKSPVRGRRAVVLALTGLATLCGTGAARADLMSLNAASNSMDLTATVTNSNYQGMYYSQVPYHDSSTNAAYSNEQSVSNTYGGATAVGSASQTSTFSANAITGTGYCATSGTEGIHPEYLIPLYGAGGANTLLHYDFRLSTEATYTLTGNIAIDGPSETVAVSLDTGVVVGSTPYYYLLQHDADQPLSQSLAISASGVLQPSIEYIFYIGAQSRGDGQASFSNMALVLTPTPEPATLSLLALGGLAVLRRRRPT